MKAEVREEIIAQVEKNFRIVGASSYDEGMQQFSKILEFVRQHVGKFAHERTASRITR